MAINPQDGGLYVVSSGTNGVMRYYGAPSTNNPSPGNGGANFVATGGGGNPIVLVFNAIDNAGNNTNRGLQNGGANLGVLNGVEVGTVFDPLAYTSITDPANAAPYNGHFRPETTGLNAYIGAGITPAQLNGVWTLEITDMRADGTAPPPVQFLDNWSITFVSGLSASTTTSHQNLGWRRHQTRSRYAQRAGLHGRGLPGRHSR